VQVGGGAVQRLDAGGAFNAKNVGGMVVSDGGLFAPMQSDTGLASTLLGGLQAQSGSGSSSNANMAEAQQRQIFEQMDEIRDTLREQGSFEASTVAASAAASVGLSVGYVVWLLRRRPAQHGSIFAAGVALARPAAGARAQ